MAFLNDNTSFVGLFAPPEGYQTKFVELTTFSISMAFATLIPTLIFAGNNGFIHNDTLALNPKLIMKNKVFGGTLDKFHIFYDGKPKIEVDGLNDYQKAIEQFGIYILGNRAYGVTGRGLFHPKIMVFEFEEKEKTGAAPKPKFRVFIGSRNLTYSNYVEAGVCIDIDCDTAKRNATENSIGTALEKFFVDIYKKENKTSKTSQINWDALKKGTLTIDKQTPESIDIHFKGFLTNIANDLTNGTEARIVSMNPQVDVIFDALSGNAAAPNNAISKDAISFVANATDLEKNSANKALVKNKRMACLIDSKTEEPKALHAKIYAIKQKNAFITWIGSANCSRNGLTPTNTEVMLRIESKMPDASNAYPIKALNGNSLFFGTKENGITYTYNAANVPEVEDEDSPLTLPATITGTYDESTHIFTLTIAKTNGKTLMITPRGFGSEDTAYVNSDCTVSFTMNSPTKNFTNIFNVVCDTVNYRVVIPTPWHGNDLPTIIKEIKIDKIKTLAELVPIQPELHSPKFDAFERILAHKRKGTWAKIAPIVLTHINALPNEETERFKEELPQLEKLCGGRK